MRVEMISCSSQEHPALIDYLNLNSPLPTLNSFARLKLPSTDQKRLTKARASMRNVPGFMIWFYTRAFTHRPRRKRSTSSVPRTPKSATMAHQKPATPKPRRVPSTQASAMRTPHMLTSE